MEELKELRVNDNRLLLKDNLVRSAILPVVASELERDVVVQGNTIVEGAVFARQLEIADGPFKVLGAVFVERELHVNTDATQEVVFEKAVGSSDSIVSLAKNCRVYFKADINAKQVKLRNAYISGSIFADEVILEDCVVIGGVFATQKLDLTNSIVGTFNAPQATISKTVHLLLPSAFTVERVVVTPLAEMYNLSLADLGALYLGKEQSAYSGKIKMNMEADELKSTLRSEDSQQVIRSYSVVGKVLTADLLDMDKFNNHFLLANAALGPQLLRTYQLGGDGIAVSKDLTVESIAEFFFKVLQGAIDIQEIKGDFNMTEIVSKFG
ncbi:MAG: hypothetical protein H6603_10185 [Flavobacteriales bacterium]|nr:hypothetical protein [Flavobacteriales bacterium]MCB9205332.1 hypothetical protein [Flavobacteriales bacterium]